MTLDAETRRALGYGSMWDLIADALPWLAWKADAHRQACERWRRAHGVKPRKRVPPEVKRERAREYQRAYRAAGDADAKRAADAAHARAYRARKKAERAGR